MQVRYFKHLLPASVLALTLMGCSADRVDSFFQRFIQAPASSIERDVKGHEQIYSVHAILRVGVKGGMIGVGPSGSEQIQVYNTYHVVGDELGIPLLQEIDIAKDDDGQMTVTSTRDHFDVIASEDLDYGLELKSYDQNGLLINHQFSGYPFKRSPEGYNVPDEENATLLVHQHFFGIGNTSLNQVVKTSSGETKSQRGVQLAYPRTLDDQPTYYDRYTFREVGGKPEPASKYSTSNIFAQEGFQLGANQVPYDQELAWRSIEVSGKPEALQPYVKGGKTYSLFKTIEFKMLGDRTPELFTYTYRDTDPVEEELGKTFLDAYNDDFIDPDTDAPRQRYGETVPLLRQNRSLEAGSPLDRLGFKGVLQFHKANVAFQMQVRICHILNKVALRVGETERPAKYGNPAGVNQGFLWDFNQLQPGWDSFDIDYPLPIRVIADVRDGEEKCYESVRRFYPAVNRGQLWQLLSDPTSYLQRYRGNVVLM